ncbi:MAG: HTTM domain-containing protein [Verrucomicrobiota bacterium]
MNWLNSPLVKSLFKPLDIASLVYLRIAFGAIMFWEVWRYFGKNRIYRYWIEPEFNFTYPGFDWVTALPGDGMYYLFIVLGLLSIMIMTGFLYRFAATLFAICFTYTFLLEQGRYLNHFYLVCLVGLVSIFLPLNRSFSLDVKFGWTKRSDTAPAWAIWMVPFLMSVVYFYGGIAKINGDWIAGEPLRDWLQGRADYPLIGPFLNSELVVMTLSWGGMLYDTLIPFLLIWKPTRLWAFILSIAFHVTNMILWSIGIFPIMAIALTAMYFPPDWPRRFFRLPRYGTEVLSQSARIQTTTAILLFIFAASQLLIPLRHWLHPGDVRWTEEGHRFAWRMKLRTRDGRTDLYLVEKKTGSIVEVDPYEFLRDWQVEEMDTHPDMMLQLAHLAKARHEQATGNEVKVYGRSVISVNGRPDQVYFNETLDLSTISRFDPRSEWLNPFNASRSQGSTPPALVLD